MTTLSCYASHPQHMQEAIATRDTSSSIRTLTIVLHRHPVGEWICLDAVTEVGPQGTGMAESRLFDERGPIGRAVQTLLIERGA